MSVNKLLPIAPDADLTAIVNGTCQNLQTQGYNVVPAMMGPGSAMITIQKNRDGIQNILGMGVECRATLTLNGSSLNINIDSEWTNKIIAIAVGWFLCLIPFITGIIGAVNQSGLPGKIETAIMSSIGSSNMGGFGTGYNPQGGFNPQGGYNPQGGFDAQNNGYNPQQ